MKLTRNLKQKMSGPDVRFVKDALLSLGFYNSKIKQITNNTFGSDTFVAVCKFQRAKGLEDDGIVGPQTWAALEEALAAEEKPAKEVDFPSLDKMKHISATHRAAIAKDLANVSELRQKIVLEILNYAYDKDVPGEPRALYIFGANLYDKDLKLNYADAAEIEKHAKRYPNYFSGGRKEWMLEQVKKNPKLLASDCSGMEVGYLREHKLVPSSFDTTANNFTTAKQYSTPINKKDLKPGDWVGKAGHIGTYVGGGLVVEFYGGAYGCQLTELNNRRGWNFVAKRLEAGSPWTRFCRPTFY